MFGDHEFRVDTLATHSEKLSANAGQPIIIDLQSHSENKIAKEKTQKKVGEIRRFKRSNRYILVKPKEEDLIRPAATIQQVPEADQSATEYNATTEVTSSDETLSCDSNSQAESDVATSAGDRHPKQSRRKKNRLHKRDVDGPRYCYACSQRL